MVVVFDELFRGTNLKDAKEASEMIIDGFSKFQNSVFITSSHFTEISDKLQSNDHVFFKCFSSKMVDGNFHYDHKLKDGVSSDRLGLQIIKEEGILEMLTMNKTNKEG